MNNRSSHRSHKNDVAYKSNRCRTGTPRRGSYMIIIGEGRKPIFDRDDLNKNDGISIKEHRIIEATIVSKNSPAKKIYAKRRSASLSPRRYRSPSPRVHSNSGTFHTYRSRSDVYSKSRHDDHHKEHRNDRRRSRSRDKSREDRYRRSSPYRRSRSHSRERSHRRTEHHHSRSERDCREKEHRDRERRHRSLDRSHDRKDRKDPLPPPETYLPPLQYIEPIPYPIYASGYAPRPLMLRPGISPMRQPVGRGNRIPIIPIRPPFPPRFIGPQFRPTGFPPGPRFR